MAAGNKLAVAERLTTELPLTMASLEAGQISFRHALVLADAVLDLQPDEVAAVEARVIEKASEQTVAQFTRSVRRAVLAAAPELAAARHEKAAAERHVRLMPGLDGMADLIAHLPAVDAETVFLALDAHGRRAAAAAKEADPGAAKQPVGAQRADALLAWAKDVLADPDLPRRQGRRAEVQVVIDLPHLAGVGRQPGRVDRLRPDPRPGRVCAGRGGRGRLAAAGDRPGQRLPARLRHRRLPPTPAVEGLPRGP
jgi:hypothetical protein